MHRAEVVRVMLAWIEENISGRLTLDEVTCRSGYSKWHFQRIFREETGKILGQYLRERRLTHTAFELRLSKKSITDIAWEAEALTPVFPSAIFHMRPPNSQFPMPPGPVCRGAIVDQAIQGLLDQPIDALAVAGQRPIG